MRLIIYNNSILDAGDFDDNLYGLECQRIDVEPPADFSPATHVWDGFQLVLR
jgi:hypothetical protein